MDTGSSRHGRREGWTCWAYLRCRGRAVRRQPFSPAEPEAATELARGQDVQEHRGDRVEDGVGGQLAVGDRPVLPEEGEQADGGGLTLR